MTSGAVVLLAAVGLALAAGAWRRVTDGRFRGTSAPAPVGPPRRPGRERDDERPVPTSPPAASSPAAGVVHRTGGALGERATLLQFSSAFCAPCRATRRVLADVVQRVDGVAHVEVDAEHHLDATRELGVLRTPTTLVLDAAGHEVARAAGAPTRAQVIAVLDRTLS